LQKRGLNPGQNRGEKTKQEASDATIALYQKSAGPDGRK
jgi:hypothetical protein